MSAKKRKDEPHPSDQAVIDAADYFAVTIFRYGVNAEGRPTSLTVHFKTINEAVWYREPFKNKALIYACTNPGRFAMIPEYQVQELFEKAGRWIPWNPTRVRPSGRVDVKLRDGREVYNSPADEPYWAWDSGSPYDIIAYRQSAGGQ